MSLLKNIFARIWALWGLLSFVITFLIIFLPAMVSYALPELAGQNYFLLVSRGWMNVWLLLVGCPVSVTGKENFIKGQAYVITFNHNAMLDVPLSCPYVPGANKTIAKASFAKLPLFGWFYSRGSVLVDRKDEQSRVKSFEAMKTVLAKGIHMCIYPEGTRNRSNEPLKPFYDGAFKLASDTGTAIIPAIIIGTKKAMPIHKTFYLLPVRLKMHFLPPIASTNFEVKELKAKVFEAMQDYYEKNV